ncbi:outer membrane protein assembly factor BamB family protein [Cellulomonas palmilytica]|uniref:outer membrane protein assembly factor BamB family protein n=1 Tax=Cellulomonas palmilytica TaxID=2608402 RepID=UPI001F22D4BC|nr:PQQ-binding-like beta-propeller repeat protein [Cellulomonas palmilytica]UJP40946.1 PQQ-binding-like beta-propeller repeat protein [Cellulomonas palmilytica]
MTRMRPVELHEGDGPDDEDVAETRDEPGVLAVPDAPLVPGKPRGAGGTDRAGRSRGRWFLVGGAVVLVVGAFVVQDVVEARREAHVARFDDVPGVLAPLDAFPVLHDGVEVPSQHALAQVGDVVLVQREGDAATVRVEALDRATGATVWTQDVAVPADLRALAEDDPDPYDLRCRAAGTDVAVCALRPTVTALGSGVPDLLVALDAADGAVLDRQPLTAEDWAVLGESVLTLGPSEVRVAVSDAEDDEAAGADGEGVARWSVEARSPADGLTRWMWTARTTVPHDQHHVGGALLETSGEHVLVRVPGHWWLLAAADGAVVNEGDQAEDEWVALGRGGALVSGTYESETFEDGSVAYTPVSGEEGFPAVLAVDDGSAPEVTFTRMPDDVLRARDVRTGALLWEHPTSGAEPILLDGTVHVLDRAKVLALDARTGDERWSAPAGDEVTSLATDGRRLLALPGFGGLLRAFARDDGSVVWEGTLPAAFPQVVAVQGVLLATDQDGADPTLVVPRP